ncbi:MAG: long-chain-fatty-acid--CoA ligase [Chloroflexi bacterium]|nr:long-chain-fatty-acid--CoA ligase [Chloroflexota bacterium]
MNTLEENLLRRNVVGDTLRRSAARYPDKTAIIFRDKHLTYRELDSSANRWANAMLALGLKRGDRVVVVSGNDERFVVVYYGLMKAGLTIVPVNPGLTDDDMQFIVNGSGSNAIVADDSSLKRLLQMKSKLFTLETYLSVDAGRGDVLGYEEILAKGEENEPEVVIEDEDACQILYTSGTEARPKGIILSHRAIMANCNNVVIEFPFRVQDIGCLVLPLHHSGGLDVFLSPLIYVGATMVVLGGFDPQEVLETIERHKVTTFWGLPIFYRAMMDVPDFDKYDLSSLRLCTYHLAPITTNLLKEAIEKFGCEFGLTFGLTEMGPVTTVFPPDAQFEKFGSIGRPILSVDLKIVDGEDNEVPRGTVGEIVYRAPCTMDGYLGLEEKNVETFRGGWLHSGDLAYMDEDGYVFFVDRSKDIVKSGGENVSSREVETVLLAHRDVEDVAVIGLPHPRWGEAVTAVVTARPQATIDEQELIRYSKERLAGFKVPKQVLVLDELPKTATGKIQKSVIRQRLIEMSKRDAKTRDRDG